MASANGLSKDILGTSALADITDTQTKQQIVQIVFGKANPEDVAQEDIRAYHPYLAYYRRQYIEALAGHTAHRPDRNHQDVLDPVASICTLQTKESIVKTLQDRCHERNRPVHVDVSTRTVELAARILTMHETSTWSTQQYCHPSWLATESLSTCLDKFYARTPSQEVIKLEKSFDARSIELVAGIQIAWTDNMAEHLSLHDYGEKQTVRIFHHATYLRAMDNGTNRTVFPEGLLAETVQTLALLFPHRDSATRRWYRQKCSEEEYLLDPAVLTCGRLADEQRQIDQFVFWRERLAILKQAFDEAEPGTLSQWWNDRRNRVQWATFWVAASVLVLTVLFGCIQSIEGALQVYKAYNPS